MLYCRKAGVEPRTLSSCWAVQWTNAVQWKWICGRFDEEYTHIITAAILIASFDNKHLENGIFSSIVFEFLHMSTKKTTPFTPSLLTLPMVKLKCPFDRSHPNQWWALWLAPAGSSLTLYPSGFPYPELSSLERQGGPGAITERGTGVIWLGTPYHTHTPGMRGREGLWTLNNVSLGLFGWDRRPNEKHYNWPKTSDLLALQTKHVGGSHGQGQSHVTPPCLWSKWVGKEWGNPSSCS